MEALRGLTVTCIYGDRETHDLCPQLPPGTARQVRLPGGHHFAKDYAALARAVVAGAGL